jgi:hypothetical protein
MALADTSPLYSVEIGHHVCDLVKVFNNQVGLFVCNGTLESMTHSWQSTHQGHNSTVMPVDLCTAYAAEY